LAVSGDDVNEYDLSTGFDVSTAVYSQNFSVAAQDATPYGLAFNSDGTKMFIVGQSGRDVNEYDLSTAFDISTAVYSQNFSVSAQDSQPFGISFNTDGTKMFIVGYSLETTLTNIVCPLALTFLPPVFRSIVLLWLLKIQHPTGIAFNNDGTKMYITGAYRRRRIPIRHPRNLLR
jgi:DNA-binding beta-propeller fold protein YncE